MPMNYTTLITVDQLHALQTSGQPFMLFDCSFELTNPAAGEAGYLAAHIPGAIYAHLDRDLSDKTPPAPGMAHAPASGGRHPLPARGKFAQWLSSVGLTNSMQAVVYDRQGVNYCGRLWWMLKWMGHTHVAVLDGGFQAWAAHPQSPAPVSGPEASKTPSNYTIAPAIAQLFAMDDVAKHVGHPNQTILDARATPRFKGEVEPLDAVAGHIPGALNRPFNTNIGADGKFKPAATLRAEFEALLAGRDPATVVHHCGSGVSAVPNILAMEIAGLGVTGLFAGSWSEWSRNPALPVAQG